MLKCVCRPRAWNGEWRVGDRICFLHPAGLDAPPESRWWRRRLRDDEQVILRTEGDSAAAVRLFFEQDGEVWPLRSTEVAQIRLTDREPKRELLLEAPMVVRSDVQLDLLAQLPRTPLRGWQPLTLPGDYTHPDQPATTSMQWLPA